MGTIAIQISSEILEGLVLSLLSKEDFYGYSLTQGVKEFLPISDSTMYPILRRLKKMIKLQPTTNHLMEEIVDIIKLQIMGKHDY